MKKSQASLEYLTTYGWAFILIIIMIGAMAFFGILNPKNLLPNRCSFSSEFPCTDHVILSTGEVRLKIKNNAGMSIILTKFDAKTDTMNLGCSITSSNQGISLGNPISGAKEWYSGDVWDIILSGCKITEAGLLEGNKEKISFDILYYNAKSSASYPHETNGEVISTVQ